jgi:hypothetical protein
VHVAIKLYEIRKQNQRAFCAFDEGALKYFWCLQSKNREDRLRLCRIRRLAGKYQIALRLSRKGCRRFFRMPEALSSDDKMFTLPEQAVEFVREIF